MGTITSGTGLISGLNTTDIINQLMAIDGQQTTLYQNKVDDATAQKTAYIDLTTRLTGLQITSQQIAKPSFFANATATSSNDDVLTATAAAGAAVGSYQFQVARLVQSEQLVSTGFTDYDKTPVGAGQLTVEVGGGGVQQTNNLSDLRGGLGISRGQIRISDKAGHSDVINLSDAITLDDVVKKINNSINVSVKASISDNELTLNDTSGGTSANLIVQDLGTTTAAADLGIATTNASGTVHGPPLLYVGRDTRLASLNDGNGVQDGTADDFTINLKDGTPVGVDLKGAVTVGDAIDAINSAGNGKVTAAISTDGTGLTLTDASGGGGTLSVASANGTTTAADLGLTAAATGNTIVGGAVQAGLGTVLLKTLNGGAGLTLGTINVTDRTGNARAIDLSGAKTLQDAIDAINAGGAGVTASIKSSGNGIQLTDTTTGTGNLIVADTAGTGAAQLGIAGTFDTTTATVQGANLQRKWVSATTQLANYNGGKGVTAGEFSVSDAKGVSYTVDIDPTTDLTLGDVIAKINIATTIPKTDAAGHVVKDANGNVVKIQAVAASINAHGDGLLLTDNTGGSGVVAVADKGGTTAASLNIAGKGTAATMTAGVTTPSTLDGTMEKTIAISATDTLANVQTKINNLGFGVTASIINDGSGSGSYRLSLNANHSGAAGQVTFDAGTTKIGTRTLVAAQDAAVFVGSGDGTTEPLLITSSKNQIVGAVKGVTLDLTSVSTDPVTVGIASDVTNVATALTTFVQNLNDLTAKIGTYTSFGVDDPTADQATTDANGNKIDPTVGTKTTTSTSADGSTTTYRQGVLLGDYSVGQIQSQLNNMLQTVVPSAGKYKSLSQVGLTFADDGTLQFDSDIFNAAYADDPNSVKALFTTTNSAITDDTQLKYLNGGDGVSTAGDDVDDFQAALKDGTTVKVAIGTVSSVGDVISAINAGSGGKLHAELDTKFHLLLTDTTTGTADTTLTQLNGSQFLTNLGIPSAGTAGVITSRQLVSNDPLSSATGGVGVNFQQTINDLINPVNGLITNQSGTIDNQISDYQTRITDLNAILESKRERLQEQFNNMEEVLSKLKNQQSSLSSISAAA